MQSPIWSAQVMIKHPNSNGMQLDINTANVIPPRYVNKMTVKRGGELVFDRTGTFSISINPNFRFTFGSRRRQQPRCGYHRYRRHKVRRAVRAERVLAPYSKKNAQSGLRLRRLAGIEDLRLQQELIGLLEEELPRPPLPKQ